MKIEIRKAISEDVPVMVKLIHEAFEKYRGKLIPPTSAHGETAQSVENVLAKGGAIIVKSEGEHIGCVLWEPHGENLYFGRLAVLPKYQKHGVGGELIKAIEQMAINTGYSGLLIRVRTGLPELVSYYSAKGFGQYPSQIGEPGKYVHMVKRLK